MKVLFDYQIFETQTFGGISRYYVELIKKFCKNNLIDWELPIIYSNNIYLENEHELFNYIKKKEDPFSYFLPDFDFKGKWKLYKAVNKLTRFPKEEFANRELSLKHIKEKDFDIFHPTYYNDYYLEYISNKPFVITVHDLIYEKFSAQNLVTDFHSDTKQKVIKKATKVIAISENTRKDLIELFKVDEKKIEVIYQANSLQANYDFAALSQSLKLPEKYLLFVGNRKGYKNFNFFIHSVAPVLKNNKDLFIVCTGSAFSQEELISFSSLGISNQMKHHFVDDISLAFFYKNALAFVFPSLYEGFGIPILEAFSCGCPAILSNTSSFPEVGGDAATYFNPADKDSIYEAVNSILNNENIRIEMRQKGYERLRLFSWEKTALETQAVYEGI